MARLEGSFEQTGMRLGTLEADLRDLRQEMVRGFADVQEIRDLRSEMRQQFYWVIGLIVVATLVPIVLRVLPP